MVVYTSRPGSTKQLIIIGLYNYIVSSKAKKKTQLQCAMRHYGMVGCKGFVTVNITLA